MKKQSTRRIGRTLVMVPVVLLFIVLGMVVLPMTESADTSPVAGSADWMAALPDDTPLSDIVIPGTHDSATQYVQLAYFSKCQVLSVGEQLVAGFRYLDIRLGDADKGADFPRLMHGFTNCKRSLLGGKLYLDEVLADCCAFLAAHPTETVLFAVKHEHGDSPDADMAKALDGFIGARPEYWLVTDEMPTLGEARGKLVLLRRWEEGDGLPLLWADQKGAADVTQNAVMEEQGSYRLWVQDRFEYGVNDKWDAFTAGLEVPAQAGDAVLSFLSTKGTSTYGHPYQFAEKLNLKLTELDSAALRGWIAVDFGTPALAEHIYRANFQ
ncbi:MAG: phosphatidylinositol-specific phospholipase C domain-containing protein [Oscillospiraceae bacterium]|nr:phosphatidylinositol-specific phospholipase C domain-containing protein [Oscillospiraceae bacterium]